MGRDPLFDRARDFRFSPHPVEFQRNPVPLGFEAVGRLCDRIAESALSAVRAGEVPDIAEQYRAEGRVEVAVLTVLCRQLQERTGDASFPLSIRTAQAAKAIADRVGGIVADMVKEIKLQVKDATEGVRAGQQRQRQNQ